MIMGILEQSINGGTLADDLQMAGVELIGVELIGYIPGVDTSAWNTLVNSTEEFTTVAPEETTSVSSTLSLTTPASGQTERSTQEVVTSAGEHLLELEHYDIALLSWKTEYRVRVFKKIF